MHSRAVAPEVEGVEWNVVHPATDVFEFGNCRPSRDASVVQTHHSDNEIAENRRMGTESSVKYFLTVLTIEEWIPV